MSSLMDVDENNVDIEPALEFLRIIRGLEGFILASQESLSRASTLELHILKQLNDLQSFISHWKLNIRNPDNFSGFFISLLDKCNRVINDNLWPKNSEVYQDFKTLINRLESQNRPETLHATFYSLKIIELLELYNGFSFNNLKEKFDLSSNKLTENINIAKSQVEQIESYALLVEQAKNKSLKQIESAEIAIADAVTSEVGQKVAENFRITANEEKKQANYYRWGAITCFCFSVVTLILNAKFGSPPLDFSELIYKAGPVLFFTIPAFYLAKESASHRADYRKYKHLSLNLPIGIKYIDGLDEKSRHMVQADFAKHLLMYTDVAPVNQHADIKQLSDQIGQINTIISEFKSAVEKIPKP